MTKTMADELLDLVDRNDRVIGKLWKSVAHKNPELIHREVAIIIYNDKGKVLFQKRSKSKKVNPGIWTESAAGHVPKGMKPIDAAHMELLEELGFETKLKFFGKTLAHMPSETHFTYWFVGEFPKGAKIKLQKDEVERVSFLSPQKLKKLIESGETYDPQGTAGQPKDMVKEFWGKNKRIPK
ncbi:MAG: Nudix hydrolase 3 [Candidatus Woesebacteria bacterium GW2011_GWC2_45_9]|uniref:Nudix hydrolase 3 n=2 Tax=Microgenomates group TaxID=1794810 RepID=A0A0G1QIR1_9BACT|nr:MAG: Nudix hydrolase 3 [Candidatus Curtissbacteria bacterium GW2011_GWC1_44_33]KKU17643.1 MAG: Nudix hydrolase 3 [Candidatus Woesebacteria bacterium GW2011_GWC2_45_9]